MNRKEYIKFLEEKGANYVWQFTKQDVNFENAFNATQLFQEWKYFSDKKDSLENFYKIKHETYNLINNYRTLIIAQLYGLLTKNKSQYKDEFLTPMFNKILTCENQKDFSMCISEQILKIKLPAIIYSKSERPKERHIFPVIFAFQVLSQIPENKILIKDFYTFIMTMNSHSQVKECIDLINEKNNITITEDLYKEYKGISRVITLLKNLDLFVIDSDFIGLNERYITRMNLFLEKNDYYLDENFKDELKYKDYLYNFQNLNINLKDHLIINKENLQSTIKDDNDYVIDVNNVIVDKINIDKINLAYNKEPIIKDSSTSKSQRNVEIGKFAILNAKYSCEFSSDHKTFVSKITKEYYMEAHHLIPMQYQGDFWNEQKINIDCIQNIVSLCPICHRALHHGTMEIKTKILEKLFQDKLSELKKIGIEISKEKLYSYYF